MGQLFEVLGTVDLVVMLAYIVGIAFISWMCNRRVKSASDFTNAGSGLGLFLVIGSLVGTCASSSTVFANIEMWYNSGWSYFPVAISWYVGWTGLILMSGKLRRSGATSISNYLKITYDDKTRKYAAWFTMIMCFSSTAAQFLAVGTMAAALGIADYVTATVAGAVLIIALTIFGGLWAVAITDTIQSVLMIVMCVVVLPIIAFARAGGPAYVYGNTPPELMTLAGAITPLGVVGLVISNLLGVAVNPAYAQRTFAAKDTKTAVTGQLIACVVSAAISLIVAQTAFTARFIFPDLVRGSDFVPLFVASYFPSVLKGLMLSAIIALLVTTGDTYLLLIASTVTDDIIRPIKPNLGDKKLLLINRLVILASAVLITVLALYVNSIFDLFIIAGSCFGSAVFCPILLSMIWKKANTKAVSIAVLVGGGSSFIWDLTLRPSTGIRGVMIGASLNLAICIIGTLILNNRGGNMQKVSQ